jgi:hypothetical protein
MVTHSSTSRPVQCLCMAERTGCPVLTDLWSYVSLLLVLTISRNDPRTDSIPTTTLNVVVLSTTNCLNTDQHESARNPFASNYRQVVTTLVNRS